MKGNDLWPLVEFGTVDKIKRGWKFEISLLASSPFRGIKRSHVRAARERRRECPSSRLAFLVINGDPGMEGLLAGWIEINESRAHEHEKLSPSYPASPFDPLDASSSQPAEYAGRGFQVYTKLEKLHVSVSWLEIPECSKKFCFLAQIRATVTGDKTCHYTCLARIGKLHDDVVWLLFSAVLPGRL